MIDIIPDTRSGIYCIRQKSTTKRYIGSTVCFRQRHRAHLSALQAGSHCNPRLQDAWDETGFLDFEFSIAYVCEPDVDALLDYEQWWIDYFNTRNPDFGFNRKAARSSYWQLAIDDESDVDDAPVARPIGFGLPVPPIDEDKIVAMNARRRSAMDVLGRPRLPILSLQEILSRQAISN